MVSNGPILAAEQYKCVTQEAISHSSVAFNHTLVGKENKSMLKIIVGAVNLICDSLLLEFLQNHLIVAS